jgi:hypothetical protein
VTWPEIPQDRQTKDITNGRREVYERSLSNGGIPHRNGYSGAYYTAGAVYDYKVN